MISESVRTSIVFNSRRHVQHENWTRRCVDLEFIKENRPNVCHSDGFSSDLNGGGELRQVEPETAPIDYFPIGNSSLGQGF